MVHLYGSRGVSVYGDIWKFSINFYDVWVYCQWQRSYKLLIPGRPFNHGTWLMGHCIINSINSLYLYGYQVSNYRRKHCNNKRSSSNDDSSQKYRGKFDASLHECIVLNKASYMRSTHLQLLAARFTDLSWKEYSYQRYCGIDEEEVDNNNSCCNHFSPSPIWPWQRSAHWIGGNWLSLRWRRLLNIWYRVWMLHRRRRCLRFILVACHLHWVRAVFPSTSRRDECWPRDHVNIQAHKN